MKQERDNMLDEKTISELKVLENPKFPQIVKNTIENPELVDSAVENINSADTQLRTGISKLLVQLSKRKPEMLVKHITQMKTQVMQEKNNMVKNNISQVLLHLSKNIPEKFYATKGFEPFMEFLRTGKDHERFDALIVLQNISNLTVKDSSKLANEINMIIRDADNPLIISEARKTLSMLTGNE